MTYDGSATTSPDKPITLDDLKRMREVIDGEVSRETLSSFLDRPWIYHRHLKAGTIIEGIDPTTGMKVYYTGLLV